MNKLENKQLILIRGGAVNFSATLVTALVRAANTVLEIGRSLGTILRRVQSGKACTL